MESATGADVQRLRERYERQAAAWKDKRAEWTKKLPEGDMKRKLEIDVFPPLERMLSVAESDYVPLVVATGRIGPEKAKALKGDELKKYNEDRERITSILHEQIVPQFRAHRTAARAATDKATEQLRLQEESARSSINFWMNVMWAVSFAAILVGAI